MPKQETLHVFCIEEYKASTFEIKSGSTDYKKAHALRANLTGMARIETERRLIAASLGVKFEDTMVTLPAGYKR